MARCAPLLLCALLCSAWAGAALASPEDRCGAAQPRGRWQALPPFPQAAKTSGPQVRPQQVRWQGNQLVVTSPSGQWAVAWDGCTSRWQSLAAPPRGPSPEPDRLPTRVGRTALPHGVGIGMLRTPQGLQQFAGATLYRGAVQTKLPAAGAPEPRLEHLIVAGADRLVVVGGRAHRRPVRDAAVLDLRTLRWTKLPTAGMPSISRPFLIAHLSATHLVVQGRRTGTGTSRGGPARVDGAIFDFATQGWTELATTKVLRSHQRVNSYAATRPAAVISHGNHVAVITAMDASAVRGALLDPARNRWRPIAGKVRAHATPTLSAYRLDSRRVLLVAQGGSAIATLDVPSGLARPIPTNSLRLAPNMRTLWTGERLILWGGHTATYSAGDSCRNVPPGVGCDPVTDPSLTRYRPQTVGYWLRP